MGSRREKESNRNGQARRGKERREREKEREIQSSWKVNHQTALGEIESKTWKKKYKSQLFWVDPLRGSIPPQSHRHYTSTTSTSTTTKERKEESRENKRNEEEKTRPGEIEKKGEEKENQESK